MVGRSRVSIARAEVGGVVPGNVVQPVPIAARAWASLLPTRASPCWSAKRTTRWCHGLPRLVGLNVSRRVGPGGRLRVVEQAAQHPALGTQRVGHERVGRDGQAARVVDGEDRRPQRSVRPDRPIDVQREQVAAEGRHLLADDDLDAQAAVAGDRPGGHGRIDPLVVGDRDDVEIGLPLDVLEDGLDPGRPVAGEGVDVQVGAPASLGVVGHAAAPVEPGSAGAAVAREAADLPAAAAGGVAGPVVPPAPEAAAASRSGQIGKKTAHHWSGASAMSSSNAAARSCIVATTRSRRVPSAGTSTGSDPAAVLAAARAAHGQRIGRDAALDGQHRRAHRQRSRGRRRAGSSFRRRSGRGRRRARPGCRRAAAWRSARRASRRLTRRMPSRPRVRS